MDVEPLDFRGIIRRAYVSEFADENCLTELTAFPNVSFTPPEDPGNEKKWIRFNIEVANRFKVSVGEGEGAAQWRVIGNLVLQVFTPLDIGTKLKTDLLNELIPVFQGKTYSGVVFRTPTENDIGKSGSWYQTNVICPFYHDTIQ